jgi:hypothetical protein
MKTYMIRVEKTQIGYYNIKCKSLDEAKAQSEYQMAVNPKETVEFIKCEEVTLPKVQIVNEGYEELTSKDWLEER